MSPTLMCTIFRSPQSSSLCVPLPLPWMTMITYLRMDSSLSRSAEAQRSGRGSPAQSGGVDAPGRGHREHVALGNKNRRLVVELSGQAGLALGRVGLAGPAG